MTAICGLRCDHRISTIPCMQSVGTTVIRGGPIDGPAKICSGGIMSQYQQDRGLPGGRARAMDRHDRRFFTVASAVALVFGLAASPAQAQRADAGGWIATWAASPQPVWDADFFALVGIPRSLRNQTVRQI